MNLWDDFKNGAEQGYRNFTEDLNTVGDFLTGPGASFAQWVGDRLGGAIMDLAMGIGGDGVPYSSAEIMGNGAAATPEIHIHGQVHMHDDAARSAEAAQAAAPAHETEQQDAERLQAEATAGQERYEREQAEMEAFYAAQREDMEAFYVRQNEQEQGMRR